MTKPEIQELRARIARNCAYLRFARGLTQYDVAGAIGITQTTVCSIEQDKHEPQLSTVVALCRLYGVPLDAMVNDDLVPVDPEKKEETHAVS